MVNKFRVIYYNLDANSKEYSPLNYLNFETLEDAENEVESRGVGRGMHKHSAAPLEPHSDPESLEVHKTEIWKLNERGYPSELVKSYTK